MSTANNSNTLESWALECLAILEENTMVANLIHRDFEDEVAEVGDTVNIEQPASFKARYGTDGAITVPLDLHLYTSFVLKDADAKMPFQNVTEHYLQPAMLCLARCIDYEILSCISSYRSAPYIVRLLNFNGGDAKSCLLEACQRLNKSKAPITGRNLILNPAGEERLLKNKLYTVPRQLGFNTLMSQSIDDVFKKETDAMGVAFHRDALVLVTRPLLIPCTSFNASAVTASYSNITMRITQCYDAQHSGVIVTIEVLAGIAVLDPTLIVM